MDSMFSHPQDSCVPRSLSLSFLICRVGQGGDPLSSVYHAETVRPGGGEGSPLEKRQCPLSGEDRFLSPVTGTSFMSLIGTPTQALACKHALPHMCTHRDVLTQQQQWLPREDRCDRLHPTACFQDWPGQSSPGHSSLPATQPMFQCLSPPQVHAAASLPTSFP